MDLISKSKKQYKANLHCHSTLSDGNLTPEELKRIYRAKGYSILAITDHEVPRNHSDLNEKDFLTVTGYEAYIRPNQDARYDVYEKEVHLNLFAREATNEAIVGYNEKYCKYLTPEEKAALKKLGPEGPREYSVEYVNEFIRSAKENGYLVAYNHPWWSMEAEADILAYQGYFSMEMCNYSSYLQAGLEYNAALYDKMLLQGKKVFCHGSDDNHNKYPEDSPMYGSFGAFTMLMPEEFTYEAVIRAMERGEMYSSMGPVFNEITLEGNHLYVSTSPVSAIYALTGSKAPKRALAPFGETITEAEFELDERAKFLRVSAVDAFRRCADTRGFFREELF